MADPLSPARLYTRSDPESFQFETTAELEDLEDAIGQARAVEAIAFGLAMHRPGFNIFALGPAGIGKHHVVRLLVDRQAAAEPVPPDWCYVNDFADARRPRALRLPPGRGVALRADLDSLVRDLREAIPAAFDTDDYRSRRKLLDEQFKKRQEEAFAAIESRGREKGIAMIRSPMGLGLAAVADGEVIEPERFAQLPPEDQERIKSDLSELQGELQGVVSTLPRWEREHRDALRQLDREVTAFAAGHLIEELIKRWADQPAVVEHLQAVQKDVVENADEFLPAEHGSGGDEGALVRRALGSDNPAARRYRVNVIVDHGGRRGAPVVYCDNPTHANLLGNIEHVARMGALVTDFSLIKPGALHQANGGYLIADARKLLGQPFSWDQLKRSLRSREARIESPAQSLGLSSTVSLEPEPLPLDVKVILIGDRIVYQLLTQYDPDLADLFKVAADFDEHVQRTPGTERDYARYAGTLARREGLRPLDRGAVARLVEHGSRLSSDATRLSAQVQELGDVVREADHLAGGGGRDRVTAADVEAALAARIRRADRVRERLQEQIRRGVLLIDTEGRRVGQINALAVYQIGGFAFGRPNRITARVRMGNGSVVDIEREVSLGGPLHSKGVLILAGFLGQRYSAERPLSLAASLVFEQSYGGVDGDSASAAELFALLSAIVSVPISQSFAVTGSVNQLGRVQAIGGVNEKIEGFFDVCRQRGLTGEQGVIIPAANAEHLMLRRDVVEAAEQGRFRVVAIETVDEGMALLTGEQPGERGEDGKFPDGSLNARIDARLRFLAEESRRFGRPQAKTAATGDPGPGDGGEKAP
jgi:lon-related putative ATP-dependent protease